MKSTYLKPETEITEIETTIIAASTDVVQASSKPHSGESTRRTWGDLWNSK